MFRKLRILILLLVLATVALGSWRANARLTAWEQTIHVAIYPVAADSSPASARYLSELELADFNEISAWAQAESRRYGRQVLQPWMVHLARPLSAKPPEPPRAPGFFESVLWSLKLRWWASQHDEIAGPRPHVRLFVIFHDPVRQAVAPHSLGLSKGQLGVIHAFASKSQQRQNHVVIAHELLHTFGASDKYDPQSLLPIFPQGFAEPERQPRFPQEVAEIMAGRIPRTPGSAEMPLSLDETVIGPLTAQEIGLLRPAR